MRSVGRKVKVRTAAAIGGRRVHEGALVSADAEAIVVASDGGELRVPYADIASASTVFEWGPVLKQGSGGPPLPASSDEVGSG
jgi:ribosome maturation factor RimP